MKSLGRIFLKGLVAMLPLAITLYVVYWLISTSESLMGPLMKQVLPEGWYFPGLGSLIGVVLIFILGLVLQAWLVRQLFHGIDALLNRLPLIKTIYGSVRDLLGFFTGAEGKIGDKVVMVQFESAGNPVRLLGLVTRDTFNDLPDGVTGDAEQQVAVYLPMSYQIGGFTVVVPSASVTPVDMTTEEALRFALTAGVTTKKQGKPDRLPG